MPKDRIAVLIVEDDEDDYMLARHLLDGTTSTRFDIRWADTLAGAKSLLDEEPSDVILLDMSLPDGSGLETLTQIRKQVPSVPIILLTGYQDDDLAVEAIHEGAQDYLVKGSVTGELISRCIHYAIERKSSEEALKRYRNHLEELVDERTIKLQESNVQLRGEITARKETESSLREAIACLEEHDRAKTEFVTNVSHELKTPLASMTYAIDNLLRGVKGPLPEGVRSYLSMLRDDAQRLRRTISDILDLGRLEAHTLSLELANVPFGRFVRQTVDSLLLHAEGSRTQIEVTIAPAIGFVRCDPSKTERALLNVIRNAIKYSPSGGRIEIDLREDPDDAGLLRLSVTDNGIGIPPDFLDRVTERYVRVGEHIDGTGLGLAIVKDIVQLHGGTITIESPPSGRTTGTCVTLTLPRSESTRVLIVDDDPDVRELLELELAYDGYTVVPTNGSTDFFEYMTQENVGLVLLDLIMPQGHGIELISRIRSAREARHVPLVVITGAEIGRATREVLEGFSIPALAKPWDRESLLNCLEESIIGKHYLER